MSLRITDGKCEVPAQVALGSPLRVRGVNDASGGWTLFVFKDADTAMEFVRSNPQAAMPCWKRPDFEMNLRHLGR
jgi:hypothetical protein